MQRVGKTPEPHAGPSQRQPLAPARADIHHSPRMVAQRRELRSLFGDAAQLESEANEQAARPVAQLLLNTDLDAGDFIKAKAVALLPAIEQSRGVFAAHWAAIRERALRQPAGLAKPHIDAFRAAYRQFGAFEGIETGKFSGAKRERFRTAYNAIQSAERNREIPLSLAEVEELMWLNEIPSQNAPLARMAGYLEPRLEATGGAQLFGGDVRRAGATLTFSDSTGQAWTITFASNAAPAFGVAVLPVVGTHTLAVTLNAHPIPTAQSDTYEHLIADEIAVAFRTYRGVGGGERLAAGATHGALSPRDQEKIETLKVARARLAAEKELYDAAPDSARKRMRWLHATERFDTLVQDMHLNTEVRRNMFAAAPGLDEATRNKGMAYGVSRQVHEESGPLGLGNPAGDAAATGVHIITPEMIEHLIAVEENSAGKFTSMGLSGGHDEALLRNWMTRHPRYQLVPGGQVDTEVRIGALNAPLSFRRFHQYRWTSNDHPAPTVPLGRPPASVAGWVKADVPKTTLHGLVAFMHEARSAFLAWHAASGADERAGATFGRIGRDQAGVTHADGGSGVEFAGYIRDDPRRGLRKVETMFAAANFF